MGTHRLGWTAEISPRLREPPTPGRVYGRRRGRRLAGLKAELLDGSLPDLAIRLPAPPAQLDPPALFETQPRDVWLEIGFGSGEHLASQAAAHPDIGFIGCEPFLNGVSNLLFLVGRAGLRNVRVLTDDARLLLAALPPGTIGRAFVLFPDPWPKRRHEGRRFLGESGLALLADSLADGAELRVATDHPALASWIEGQVADHPAFALVQRAIARPDGWPATRYEEKARQAGRGAVYLSYERRPRVKPAA